MCQDSVERFRALRLCCIYEDYNLKLYWLFVYGTSHFPLTIILNNFYISTKCKVDLSTKAAHFGLSHTMKRSSKWPLFNFFSEISADVIEMNFARICAFQWTKVVL